MKKKRKMKFFDENLKMKRNAEKLHLLYHKLKSLMKHICKKLVVTFQGHNGFACKINAINVYDNITNMAFIE